MKAIAVLLLAALTALADAPTAAAQEGGDIPLKVMTFNVRYGSALDGQNAWPLRRELVAAAIAAHDPDIVGLQECLDFQAVYLVEALPQYRWFGIGRDRNGGGEMAAILYKPKVITPITTGSFWLSETPDEPASRSWDAAITRIVTWMRVFHPESGRYFQVYNTHYDHRGEEARANSSRVLAARLAELPEDEPVVLTGDFNAKGGASEPWQVLIDAGLQDTWLAAAERVGPPVTFSRWTHPQEGVDSRIDWVMTRGKVSVARCETVLHNEDGRYPSDHYPVAATLTLHANE